VAFPFETFQLAKRFRRQTRLSKRNLGNCRKETSETVKTKPRDLPKRRFVDMNPLLSLNSEWSAWSASRDYHTITKVPTPHHTAPSLSERRQHHTAPSRVPSAAFFLHRFLHHEQTGTNKDSRPAPSRLCSPSKGERLGRIQTKGGNVCEPVYIQGNSTYRIFFGFTLFT
jgi:hypothetical protein